MEFMEVVRKRRSIRRYKDKHVPMEKIRRVLEAARLAPSWKNGQCWEYIVVNDYEKLKELKTGLNKPINAPTFIVACGDPSKSGKHEGKDYYLVDVAISMEHLVLAATNEGLGTCWMGLIDEEKIKNLLGIPKKYRVVAVTPIGYPDEGITKREKKSLESFVHLDSWGTRLEGKKR